MVALAVDQGAIWVTVLADGSVLGFQTTGSEVTPVPVVSPALPIGQPPLLQLDPEISVLTVADSQASDLSHGIPTKSGVLFVTRRGDLQLGSEPLSVQALPDARIVGDGTDQWLVLAAANDQRYRHGVLGDRIEATQILRFETEPTLRALWVIDLDPTEVVEGIAPIWADLDGEPGREVSVTFSTFL